MAAFPNGTTRGALIGKEKGSESPNRQEAAFPDPILTYLGSLALPLSLLHYAFSPLKLAGDPVPFLPMSAWPSEGGRLIGAAGQATKHAQRLQANFSSPARDAPSAQSTGPAMQCNHQPAETPAWDGFISGSAPTILSFGWKSHVNTGFIPHLPDRRVHQTTPGTDRLRSHPRPGPSCLLSSPSVSDFTVNDSLDCLCDGSLAALPQILPRSVAHTFRETFTLSVP